MKISEKIATIAAVIMALAAIVGLIFMYLTLQKMDDANRIAIEKLSTETGRVYHDVTELIKEPTPIISEEVKCKVKTINPLGGARVPHTVPITGTVENLPQGKELWIVKEIAPGNYHPDRGPAFIVGNTWKATAYIGNNSRGADTGMEFIINIVMVSHETGKKFDDYINMAYKTGNWSGISTIYDGEIVSTVKVIRDDSSQ